MRNLIIGTTTVAMTLLGGVAAAFADGDGRDWAENQFKTGQVATYGGGATGEMDFAELQQGADGLCTVAQVVGLFVPGANMGCAPSIVMALNDLGKTAESQTVVQTQIVQGKTVVVHVCYNERVPGKLVPMERCLAAVKSSKLSSAGAKPATQAAPTIPPVPKSVRVAEATKQ